MTAPRHHTVANLNAVEALPWWTEADQAELDCLVEELVRSFWDHRERGCRACALCAEHEAYSEHEKTCRVCQGEAPLTFGWHCEHRARFLAHTTTGTACACLPCPHVMAAVEIVVEWHRRRSLLSRSRFLRLDEELRHVQAELKELSAT